MDASIRGGGGVVQSWGGGGGSCRVGGGVGLGRPDERGDQIARWRKVDAGGGEGKRG